MKRSPPLLIVIILNIALVWGAIAATQDKYELPEPYLSWEKSYLKEFPRLQAVIDVMIRATGEQMKDPDQDILHNRVCSALVFWMAREHKLSTPDQMLAIAGDLLHNISKEQKEVVLTNPELLHQASQMVTNLKERGFFKNSPRFWSDETLFKNPKIGNNRALIHHITGAIKTGQILNQIGGYSQIDIEKLQVAIIEHSTGYWYFRASIDEAAGYQGAWEVIFPEPENDIAKFTHDADLISQFVPESVVPDGSKWRELAKKRWGAKDKIEEGHIVYYVFFRLFEEAKTKSGKELAREQWEKIRPELVKLMNLNPDQDPIKVLGVPKIFQK